MVDFLLAWGNIYLPIGFVFMLLAIDREGIAMWLFFIVGGAFALFGIVAMRWAWDKVKEQEDLEESRHKELIDTIKSIRRSYGDRKSKRHNM